MTTADIISFKEHILSKNKYFDNGYAVAFKDAVSKRVVVHTGLDFMQVMPTDTLGSYFYIRYEKGVEFKEDFSGRIADSNQLSLSFNDRMGVVLVAFMKGADEYKLLNNLRVTCAMFKNLKAIPTSAVLIREQVVQDEMSGAKKEDIEAALQRLGEWTIISLNVSLQKQYIPSNCIVEPCKDC